MPIKIQYLEGENIIHLISEGIITFETIKQAAKMQAALAAKYNSMKWLNVVKQNEFHVSVFDLYHIPELMHLEGINKKLKLAIVVERGEKNKYVRFIETVCRNSGFNIKVFKEVEEAKIWLIGG